MPWRPGDLRRLVLLQTSMDRMHNPFQSPHRTRLCESVRVCIRPRVYTSLCVKYLARVLYMESVAAYTVHPALLVLFRAGLHVYMEPITAF